MTARTTLDSLEEFSTGLIHPKAFHLYGALHNKLIYVSDDIVKFESMMKERGFEPGSSVFHGYDFCMQPEKKPIIMGAAKYGRTKILRALVRDQCAF
jgi:hypothetical protein